MHSLSLVLTKTSNCNMLPNMFKKIIVCLSSIALVLNVTAQDSAIAKKNTGMKPYWCPITLFALGATAKLGKNMFNDIDLATRNKIQAKYNNLSVTRIDDVLQFAPAAFAIGINSFAKNAKHKVADQVGIYALTTMITTATVHTVKKLSNLQRPNGSGYHSFPSGHTATAFAAAEMLHQEYKHLSPWYGVAGYTVAATVGSLRVYNNKHWVSDVLAGAAFGLASTKLAYLLYPKVKKIFVKKGKNTVLALPIFTGGQIGFSMVYQVN